MPNVQIRGSQIQGETIDPGNINLSGSFDFRAATGFQITTKPEADNSTFPATTAYVHTIVSGSAIDGFQGGDGISINTGTSPDTIAVDLATNSGLAFSSNKLIVNLDGSTLALGAGGLSVGTAISNANIASDAAIAKSKLGALAITNSDVDNSAAIAISKLAASTISGKSLGTNLADLTDGNGIADFTFNGSSAASIAIDLDGSTLAVGASGLKISDGGVANAQIADDAINAAKIADDAVGSAQIADDAVGSAQIADLAVDSARLANNAVTNAKINNGAVSIAKLSFQSRQDVFNPNGSTAAFDLANQVAPEFDNFVMAFVNGLLQNKVASSPSGQQEYTVSTAGSTTTVTFGANLADSDHLEVRYLA
jgi:hypothetical protein